MYVSLSLVSSCVCVCNGLEVFPPLLPFIPFYGFGWREESRRSVREDARKGRDLKERPSSMCQGSDSGVACVLYIGS